MKRIWAIEEQHVNDEASGFGFTFASHPSDDGLDDNTVSLTIYNTGRDKKIVLVFDRNGFKTTSTVEPHDVAEDAADVTEAEDAADITEGRAAKGGASTDDIFASADEAAGPEAHHWVDPGLPQDGSSTLAAGSGT